MKKTSSNYRRRWLIRGGSGLALVGFGASLIAEAAMLKYSGGPTLHWVAYGTLALIVFNSGLSIFGDAILQRVRYERALLEEATTESEGQ